jgi:acetyltransferase-like isoleucine patch superfamily enzyme
MPTISTNIRVRVPEHFVVGEDSIVDDYCYFSTRVRIGRASHVASGCSVAGGASHQFTLGDYSSLSSGVKIWCTSDDFVNDIVTIIPAAAGAVKTHLIEGDVIIGNFTAVGSNSVVMPGNEIPEGTVIGALSFVPPRFTFELWSVYAGTPIRLIGRRNKENVLSQIQQLDRALKVKRD